MSININDLTLGQIKEIQGLNLGLSAPVSEPATPWVVGEQYFIRTITYHATGRLTAIYPGELVLDDAAWIADSGRFTDALIKGDFDEIEPFPGAVIISRSSIVDATVFSGLLPRHQK